MPSYTIMFIPKNVARDPSLLETVKSLSIETDKLEFKEGTMPDSIEQVEGGIVFELGFWDLHEYETIERGKTVKKSIKELKRVAVIILDSGFLFVGYCPAEIADRLQSLIESNFLPGLMAPRVKFNESVLRAVIESVPDVIKADLRPSKMQEPDLISATRRVSVTETPFWADYGGEPLDFVKVILTRLESQPRVGFRKNGVVTIHAATETFTLAQHAAILRYVAERILGPYLAQMQGPSFQTKLKMRQ